MTKPARYETEAALCADFISALPKGWTAYAETGGFDILLVRDDDGFQIGVEAKLRFNAKVLCQALESNGRWYTEGPDCRAVLVPDGNGDLAALAHYIGVAVITLWPKARMGRDRIRPFLPRETKHFAEDGRDWPQWAPERRCALPDYVPDVAAGSSAPVKLTHWKVAALKIAVLLERRGIVTRADFKALDIDIRRWLPSGGGWLVAGEGGYRAGRYLPDFKAQHPVVWEQIAADFDKWAPPAMPRQGSLLNGDAA